MNTLEKHKKHQAMLERHKLIKAEKREEHNRPNRTKKFPPNTLK